MEYISLKENMVNIDFDKIASEIVKGKIVIFPTETLYGIGTNAYNEEACKKIFKIKERPNTKPLIILISDYEMLCNIVEEPNEIEKKLINKFWPGPLTIIFKRKKNFMLPDIIVAKDNTIGVRMTNGKIIRLLLQKSNVPIVAPSANISGKADATKIKQIVMELGEKVDYVLDSGNIEDNVPSTIVKVVENSIYILREGKIIKEELMEIAPIK